MIDNLRLYLTKIHESLMSGQATEHSYRPELRDLFGKISWYKVINEPKWSEYGRPDFIFLDNMFPVCHWEAKDINISLEKIENSEQLSRYFWYAKLILTNGIEFRFYNNWKRYWEPIILAELKWWQLNLKEQNFDYFLRSFYDFLKNYVDTVRNAEHLAKIMWWKARRIRDNMIHMLQTEKLESYSEIKKIKVVFKDLLIHDLDDKKFADLYAQTLVYWLFVARYNDKTPEDFSRSESLDLVPKSNPLLRKFFDHIAWEAFEKRLAYIVDELCGVFRFSDVNALMHWLYQKKDIETHDPVIHFYEDFLSEYDKALKIERWVFYTPMPVVKFMIRAIDEILKDKFWLTRWLLDTSKINQEFDSQMLTKWWIIKKSIKQIHRVQLLDPAVGTWTFLNEVIKFIYGKMQNQQWLWKEYVKKDLIPRLHWFELMMASYTIAHLKLWLTLSETWIDSLDERLKIYLTNSLEEWIKIENDLFSHFWIMESLTEEAKQAGYIKSEEKIMIILWNPPYSWISTNNWERISKKIEDYKYVNWEHFWEKKHWLWDDYVKFFRLSESLIERNGEWIISFITNHWYIDNPTFRGMRYHLLKTFDEIYIVDLHGNSKKKETSTDWWVDQNVFDIQQGVSIFLWVKNWKKQEKELAKVFHVDLYGRRNEKYKWLEENDFKDIEWKEVLVDKKYYFFCPKDFWVQSEYDKWFWVNELFSVNVTGIVTARDGLVISESKEGLLWRMKKFFDETKTDEQIRIEFFWNKKEWKYLSGDSRWWKLSESRKILMHENHEKNILKIAYRPFDDRYVYYHSKMVDWGREKFMKNMFTWNNLWLTIWRQGQVIWWDEWNIVSISKNIVDFNYFYRWWELVFPLYLYSEESFFEFWNWEKTIIKTPNFDKGIISKIEEILWIKLIDSEQSSELQKWFTPEDLLDYIYAVLYSKNYREIYKSFLKIDFPKIPYPKDKSSFFEFVRLWNELRSYHLLENQKVYDFITTYPIEWENLVEKVVFEDEKVYINNKQYFWWIKREVFDFMIWWYKPAYKYLNDRKWRILTSEEFENYQKMIVALSETIKIMEEIEVVFKV